MEANKIILSIVIPCYYNDENIPVTTKKLEEIERTVPEGCKFEYVLVDDGSKDGTWGELLKFYSSNKGNVKIIKLSKNVGSYTAILAGLKHATGNCCTVISADLQDPPELIPEMIRKWQEGYMVVMANRVDRDDGFLNNFLSKTFHKLIKKYALHNIPEGGFDFVLFDRILKDELLKINEKNTNTLYLLPWMGFKQISIPYRRSKRKIGKSRWTFSKKVKLFVDSFIAFSFLPIRLITITGLLFGLLSFLYAIFILIARFTNLIDVQGWSTLIIVILLVSSFQMIAIGIIGEYLWRILDASRNRPNYIEEIVLK